MLDEQVRRHPVHHDPVHPGLDRHASEQSDPEQHASEHDAPEHSAAEHHAAQDLRSRRRLRALAVGVGALSVLLSVIAPFLVGVNDPAGRGLLTTNTLNNGMLGLALGLLAPVLCIARPRNRLGWLLLFLAISNALVIWCEAYGVHALVEHPGSWPGGLAAAWVGTSIWPIGFGPAFVVLPLLYPTGRTPGGLWRVVLLSSIVASLAMVVGLALSSQALHDDVPGVEPIVSSPIGMPLFAAGFVVTAVTVLATAVHTFVRLSRARWPERQQLAWLIVGTLPSYVSLVFAPEAVSALLLTLIPIGLVLGVLRYRLFDITVVLHRTLVYGALTTLVLLTYAGVVAVLTALVPRGPFPAVVAAAAVVLLVRPAYAFLQQRVSRYVYGDRNDPLRALTRLGQELSEQPSGLQRLAETVRTALRSPDVSLWVRSGDDEVLAARSSRDDAGSGATGADDTAGHSIELSFGGTAVGRLDVAWRTATEPLSEADLGLLELLAVPIAIAVHADLLTDDLRESRARLQLASDAERDRLRRDLHDGLGPSLSGVVLGLGAARTAAARGQTERLDDMLSRIADEVGGSVGEVRRLVDGLRPAALIAGDLVAAVRAHVDTLTATGELEVTVLAPDTPIDLPAPVEEAAYRICLEAVTNVLRHAHARRCEIRIGCGATLELTIRDDGVGIPEQRRTGVGLLSMRSRAEAVGGCLSVNIHPAGGTVVAAELPMAHRAVG